MESPKKTFALLARKMNITDQQKAGPITINKTFQTLACKD